MKRKEGFAGQISYVIPESIQTLIQGSLLISDLYLTDIGYYPNAKHHFRERPAGVNQTILIYCTAGKGNVKINSSKHELIADQFIIIPPNSPHSYFSDSNNPWSIFWIHFCGSKAAQLNNYSNKCLTIDKGPQSRINDRVKIFEEIFRNLERGFGMDSLEFVNMSLHYLLVSFTHINQFRMIKKGEERDPVARSINYMLENLNHPIRLEDLAKLVQLSSSHFSRLFVNNTGQSPMDYFKQLKIQRACSLLDISDLSIAEVASELGFDDPFYFSRIFKSVMGVSPRGFRKTL